MSFAFVPRRFLAVLFAGIVAFSPGASARVIDANVSGNWGDAATWIPAVVPVAADTVRINTTVTVDVSSAKCARLLIGTNGGRYTAPGTLVLSGGTAAITVSGDAVFGGSFNTGTLTMSAGAFSAGGAVSVVSGSLSITGGTFAYTGGTQTVTGGTYQNLVLSNGTKNAGGAIVVKGTLTIDSTATFNGLSFTHTVFGDWNNAGTFNGGTGEVILNGATTQTITGGKTFHDLYLASGPKVATGAIVVGGDFTISSSASFAAGRWTHIVDGNWICTGTFSADSGVVSLAGSTTQIISGTSRFHNLAMYNPGTKTVTGTIAVDGLMSILPGTRFDAGSSADTIFGDVSNGGVFDAEGGTIIFKGSSRQTVSGDATFGLLRINNASGVSFEGSTVFVDSTLGLLAGNVILNNTLLFVGPGAAITSAGPTSYVVTNGTGSLVQSVSSSSSVIFPVGPALPSFDPLTIGLAAGDPDEAFAVRVAPLSSSTFGFASLDTTRCVKLAWYVTEAVPGGNHANLGFNWNHSQDGSDIGVTDNSPIALKALAYDAGAGAYAPAADVTGTATSVDPLTASTAGHSLTTFGFVPYIVGLPPVPLAITLASFSGTVEPGIGVRLEWKTASEVNNYGFYVQRKPAADTTWTELAGGFIPGQGTTASPHDYAYVDSTAGSGAWEYRLRQVDLSGDSHYFTSTMVDVTTAVKDENAPHAFALQQNYPNPFNPATTISYDLPSAGRVTLKIYDILGRLVATLVDESRPAGRSSVRFDASGLASGMYVYRLTAPGGRSTARTLILLK